MKVLNHLFQQRDWIFVNYHDKMTHEVHDKMTHEVHDNIIIMFCNDWITKIIIIFLKCNNIKLNFIMIFCIICIDLWWNSSVKQQVFCHICMSKMLFKKHKSFSSSRISMNKCLSLFHFISQACFFLLQVICLLLTLFFRRIFEIIVSLSIILTCTLKMLKEERTLSMYSCNKSMKMIVL